MSWKAKSSVEVIKTLKACSGRYISAYDGSYHLFEDADEICYFSRKIFENLLKNSQIKLVSKNNDIWHIGYFILNEVKKESVMKVINHQEEPF